MLYLSNKKQFVNSTLVNPDYILTDIIRDMNNFGGKIYFDETNTYYLSIVYGSSETITIFDCYSKNTLDRAKEHFKNAEGFCFVCSYKDYNENVIDVKHGLTYHYKYTKEYPLDDTINLKIKRIDSDSSSVLEIYDEMYMSFLRKNHAARLENYWNRYETSILKGEHAIYIAYINDTMIGFVLVDFYFEHNACDISQITIEPQYQKKGYGKQLANLIARSLKKEGYDTFYSSVEGDNIASQKTAERAGFEKVVCRIGIL